MKKIIVSACLLGENCKYNGGNNYSQAVADYVRDKIVIPVCPEVAGGLLTPRPSAEIVNGVVKIADGTSVDKEFRTGAKIVIEQIQRELAEGNEIECAILQSRSPSCGVHWIYDGTFSGKLIKGQGVFAEELSKMGIKLIDKEQL